MSRTAKEIETTGLPCEAQNGETIQVVPKIDVTMFGKFTLKQEGMEVPHVPGGNPIPKSFTPDPAFGRAAGYRRRAESFSHKMYGNTHV